MPHLVHICRVRCPRDWNLYALIAIIELARAKATNPPLPRWLERDYSDAIQQLAELGAREVLYARDSDAVRAILSILAIAKGLRLHAKLLLNFNEDEMREAEARIYEG